MTLAPGSRVDRYELLAPLGAGGQGSVWKARDPLEAGVVRAVKLVELAGTKPAQLERVRREARALAKLEHPSLVKCHAMFEDLNLGVLGLVLDFVDGPSLGDLLEDPKFSELRRTTVLLHVARALAYLHEQGVVHRDLKLENTLVREAFWDEPDNPHNTKVVDFGIAAIAGGGTALTAVGHIVGTPAYMAPELLDPNHFGTQAPASCGDVFSFGVLAWKLLVGGHPTGLPPQSSLIDYAVKYRAAMNRHPAWEGEPVPGPWGRLLLDCLEPDPCRRIQDGASLVDRVRQAHRATRVQFESQKTLGSADAATVAIGGPGRGDLVTDVSLPPQPALAARAPTERGEPPSPLLFPEPRPAEGKPGRGPMILAGVFVGLFLLALVVAVGGTAVFAFMEAEGTSLPAAPINGPETVPAQRGTSPATPTSTEPTPVAPWPVTEAPSVAVDSRPKGCPSSVGLCSCCVPGKKCCGSGSDCRGSCADWISPDDGFKLRVAGAALEDEKTKRADVFKVYPEAEVCVRKAGQGSYVCTRLADVRSKDAPEMHLPVEGRDLTQTGLDMFVRSGNRVLGGAEARKHRGGLQRSAICEGVFFNKDFGGDAGLSDVSFFLDDPNNSPPRRCVGTK